MSVSCLQFLFSAADIFCLCYYYFLQPIIFFGCCYCLQPNFLGAFLYAVIFCSQHFRGAFAAVIICSIFCRISQVHFFLLLSPIYISSIFFCPSFFQTIESCKHDTVCGFCNPMYGLPKEMSTT